MDALDLRASMVYSKELRKMGNKFILEQKLMQNADDLAKLPGDYQGTEVATNVDLTAAESVNGYLAVHLRRGDFLRAHPDKTPGWKHVSKQISRACDEMKKGTEDVCKRHK
jgi:hypothetical protein